MNNYTLMKILKNLGNANKMKNFSFHQLSDKEERIQDSYCLWKLLPMMYGSFSGGNEYLESQELLQNPFSSYMFMNRFSRKQ